MKLAMFKNPKDYANWCNREADLIEANGLKFAKGELVKAKRTGRDIEWHENHVRYLTRKVNKYRRDAAKALAM